MANYPAVIHKEDDSDWGISFPDFPGCVSAGETIEEAMQMGAEALQFHIDGMAEDGEAIPPPMNLESAATAARNSDGAVVMVRADVPDERVERVNVTLPRSTLRLIDSLSTNRSGFLNEAAMYYARKKDKTGNPVRGSKTGTFTKRQPKSSTGKKSA